MGHTFGGNAPKSRSTYGSWTRASRSTSACRSGARTDQTAKPPRMAERFLGRAHAGSPSPPGVRHGVRAQFADVDFSGQCFAEVRQYPTLPDIIP